MQPQVPLLCSPAHGKRLRESPGHEHIRWIGPRRVRPVRQPRDAILVETDVFLRRRSVHLDGPALADEFAPTVLSDRGMNWVTLRKGVATGAHPRLRKHEYAALQTFPPTYQWPAGEQLALKQIGNAVPPLLAQLLMREPH